MDKYYLIGHPLGHSLSPFIHGELAGLCGAEIDYSLFDIAPAELESKIDVLKMASGFNVTIPHKTNIIPYLNHIDKTAESFGAVNTVNCKGSELYGYNTDVTGFLRALEIAGISLSGSVLLCGCGGVARMFAFEALQNGCTLTIAVRDAASALARAEKLIAGLRSKFPDGCISKVLYSEISGSFDIVINGTPVGMYPNIDNMVLTEEQLSRCGSVYDAIYNPYETKLVKTAKKLGIPCSGGLSMLVWQAAAAQEIWLGRKFTPEQVDTVIEASRRQLIGKN